MKRHPALRSFSDDHHQGLVHALRLKRATDDLEGTARAFLAFWHADTKLHFRREEEELLPVLALDGMDLEQEPFPRMLDQHARLRGLVRRLDGKLGSPEKVEREDLETLGNLLEEHIRLEERVVFPRIEAALSEEALAQIAAAEA